MKRLHQIALASIAILSTAAGAQTRYVSDDFFIPFRTGPSTQNAITRNLFSGTRVEILEEREDVGYARVRLEDDSEGWVLTQYLQAEQIAEVRLEVATRELNAARDRIATLDQRVGELTAQLAATGEALADGESTNERMSAELADIRSASAQALETRAQNESLRRSVADLTSAAQVAELEIDGLRRRERQNWFILGASVLFGGIIIGLVAPTLRRKKRSSW